LIFKGNCLFFPNVIFVNGINNKVIIDSNFNSMGDDGRLLAMVTRLMVQGNSQERATNYCQSFGI